MVSEDTLVLLCRTHISTISIRKVTVLSNQKPRFSGDPPLFHPDFEIPYPRPVFKDGELHDCTGPCDWYSGTNQPLLLIHSTDGEDTASQFTRFEVTLGASVHADLLTLEMLGIPDETIFEPYRFSQGTLTTWWYDDGHMQGQITSTKEFPMAEKVANVYLFEVDMDLYLNISSFCPSSGRLVCLDFKQDVHIVDFLTPGHRPDRSLLSIF